MVVGPIRPSDYEYALLSRLVYMDDGGNSTWNEYPVLDNWSIYQIKQAANGLFAAAYINYKTQNIVFAFRGTNSWKSILTDIHGIILTNITDQQQSAYEFVKSVLSLLDEHYRISFTGHSLGSWLAELMLWQFTKEFAETEKPVNAITFDSPGSLPMINMMEPQHNNNIDPHALDLIIYMGPPNPINTFNHQLRSDIRHILIPAGKDDIESLSFWQKLTPSVWRSISQHQLDRLLDHIDITTGIFPENQIAMLNKWPHGLSELHDYYKQVKNQQRQYCLNMYAMSHENYYVTCHAIHYEPKAYDISKLYLNHVDPVIKTLLIEIYKNQSAWVTDKILSKELEKVNVSLGKLAKSFEIKAADAQRRTPALLKTHHHLAAENFRDQITKLIYDNPTIYSRLLLLSQGVQISEHAEKIQHQEDRLIKLETLSLSENKNPYQNSTVVKSESLSKTHHQDKHHLTSHLEMQRNKGDYIRSLLSKGHIQMISGYYLEAKEIFNECKLLITQELGEQHEEFPRVIGEMGKLYFYLGDFYQSLDLLKQEKKLNLRFFRENSLPIALNQLNLSLVYLELEENTEAHNALNHAMPAIKKAYGNLYDISTWVKLLDLIYLNDEDKAAYLTKSIATFTKKTNVNYIEASIALARLYLHKDLAKAISILEEAYKLSQHLLGNSEAFTITPLILLAQTSLLSGNTKIARKRALETIRLCQKIFQEYAHDHPFTATAEVLLALSIKKYSPHRAQKILADALRIRKYRLGRSHSKTTQIQPYLHELSTSPPLASHPRNTPGRSIN